MSYSNPMGYYESIAQAEPHAFQHTEQDEPPQSGKVSRENPNRLPYKMSMGVQERSPARLIISTCGVDGSQNAIKVVDKVRGRKFVILKVPSTATTGVLISHHSDEISTIDSWDMQPGDPPLYIPTEASIWAASDTSGQTSKLQIIVGIAEETEY
jgi:hypothetical protein